MMLGLAVDILSWACLMGGAFFMVIGAVGVLRFPDFWTRLHATSVSDSGGMLLILLGLCLQAGFTLITVKLIIIGIFLFITGPTATHAVANAALVTGWRPKHADGLSPDPKQPYLDLKEPVVSGK
ncbi:MAG: monovalent cation/H(+) antiporter subunit G [Pseudomonadota bacterium]